MNKKVSLLTSVKAVLWGFFGVRRRDAARSELEDGNPLALIAVGLLLASAFVGTLVLLANLAVVYFGG